MLRDRERRQQLMAQLTSVHASWDQITHADVGVHKQIDFMERVIALWISCAENVRSYACCAHR